MTIPPDIIRVFPRRTSATPTDAMAFVGPPPLPAFRPLREEVREVHVSCTFTWEAAKARDLVHAWAHHYAIVRIGGPAIDGFAGAFTPGMYLRPGLVITSRGCPNRCEFCLAWQREGFRELAVTEGYDVLDNNLLACSRRHIELVLEMTQRAKSPRGARFTGGLQASLLRNWFARAITTPSFHLDCLYLAYDRPTQFPAVQDAIRRLREFSGWSDGNARRKINCYVLAGEEGDTEGAIRGRLEQIAALGATPFPMFYRAPTQRKDPRIDAMKRTLRRWMRPTSVWSRQRQPEEGERG